MNRNIFEFFTKSKFDKDPTNEETTDIGSGGSIKETRGRFPAGMCKQCPSNSYVNGTRTDCIECESGQQVNDDKTGCEPCPIGTAGTDGTCEPCINDETYQDETGQTTCKECSKCEAHYYVSRRCSQSSNTVCSRCNRKITKDYGQAHLEINTYGSPHNVCNGNCKVDIFDNLLKDYDDVDIAGKSTNEVTFTHYLKENQHVHAPNNPVKISGLSRNGNNYYFWQRTLGSTDWKFNIMTNPRKYNPPNNYLTSCMECAVNKRPNKLGTECLNLFAQTDMLKSNKVW